MLPHVPLISMVDQASGTPSPRHHHPHLPLHLQLLERGTPPNCLQVAFASSCVSLSRSSASIPTGDPSVEQVQQRPTPLPLPTINANPPPLRLPPPCPKSLPGPPSVRQPSNELTS